MRIQAATAELAEEFEAAIPPLTDEDRRLARTLLRLLAGGDPVATGRLAEALGRPEPEVAEVLTELPHGVYRDELGRVVGFGGLALADLAQTPHRLRIDGRELYAWCAGDTLFLPSILDREAQVESRCPTTGERISLTVSPDGFTDLAPPGTVMSFLRPERWGLGSGDVIRTICHFIHFFAHEEAARAWIAEHEGTVVLSVGDGFELGRVVLADLHGVGPRVEAHD
jgi:alkylmercury lyase